MVTWLGRHMQVMFSTLGAMKRTPMASINTIVIIGIALLLPCLLYVAVKTGQSLSENWQGRPQATIFLRADVSSAESNLIYEEIRLHPSVELAELISPQQALEEFRVLSGMDYQLDFIGSNPLPHSIVIMPDQQNAQADKLQALQEQLSKIDGIDSIRLDLDWTDRFNSILQLVTRIAMLLSGLLALALVLIVGNTIKLLILNRRQEIEITKLVGGTDTFVRRPFLYYGSFYGLLGGLLTLMLLTISGQMLQEPLQQLSALYNRSSLIYPLKWQEIGLVVLIGVLIGWFAARWSVARHLRAIKPR